MPLFRDASNDRVYLIEPQFIKWLTNGQFNAMQQPYVSIANALLGPVCGAYDVPVNVIPTVQGLGWSYAMQVNQSQTSIAVAHKNEIINKIDSTHSS